MAVLRFKIFIGRLSILCSAGNSKILAEDDAVQNCDGISSLADNSICLPAVEAWACLQWKGCNKPEPPRVTIEGRSDATQPEQKLIRNVKMRWRIDPKSIVEGILTGHDPRNICRRICDFCSRKPQVHGVTTRKIGHTLSAWRMHYVRGKLSY